MHTGDDADSTEVADAVAVAAAEPTEMAGVAEADTQSAYAWSLDEGEDDEPQRQRSFVIVAAAVGISLCLVMVAGVLAYRHLGDENPAPVVASAPSTTTSPMAAPLPPSPPAVTVTTVVVQAPPSTVTAQQQVPPNLNPSIPTLTPSDWDFLSQLEGQGWIISDPALFAQRGHETCAMLHNGEPTSLVQQKLMQLNGVTNGKDAWMVIDAAMASYPNCP